MIDKEDLVAPKKSKNFLFALTLLPFVDQGFPLIGNACSFPFRSPARPDTPAVRQAFSDFVAPLMCVPPERYAGWGVPGTIPGSGDSAGPN